MIRLEGISKYYTTDANVVLGLRKVNLELKIGEFVAITGESGSGKSTLLNVISGLDKYDEGEMFVLGEETSYYSTDELEQYRKLYIGFVFQSYNIIDSYTVLENIMLALALQGYPKEKRKARALELIDKVGLTSHINHRSSKLSGGQKQRAVIARALAKDCPIIVADEPTGNLDEQSGEMIMALLKEISKDKLVIVVTHNYEQVSPYVTRKIRMYDGEVVEDKEMKAVLPVEEKAPLAHYQMNFIDLVKFSLKNMYRIPKKSFLLLLFTALAITSVFLVYSNYQRTNNESFFTPYNNVFYNNYSGRVIVTRDDEQPFTKSELDSFKAMDRVLGVQHFDFVNEMSFFGGDYMSQRYLTMVSAVYFNNDWLVEGRLPVLENEILVQSNGISVIGEALKLYYEKRGGDINEYVLNMTIVGFYEADVYFNRGETAFVSDHFLNGTASVDGKNPKASNIYFNNFTVAYKNETHQLEYNNTAFIIDDNVSDDTVFISQTTANQIRQAYNDNTTDINTLVNRFDVTIIKGKDNHVLENTTYIVDNSLSPQVLKVNLKTSEKYLKEAIYQITLNTLDKFDANLVMDKVAPQYHVVYPAKSTDNEFMQFLTVGLIFLMTFVLGFIYIALNLVQKNVINSRKKDFVIFRSIGASRRDLVSILYIEQIFYVFFGFLLAYSLTSVLERFIDSMVVFRYITLQMHLAFWAIFIIIGLMLARKFSVKLFGKSVITTLKAEN